MERPSKLCDPLSIDDEDGDSLVLRDVDSQRRQVMAEARGQSDSVQVALFEDDVRKLVAWGQAWLDAPRDAARAAAEVVIDDTADDVRLVRTTLGEWGVGQVSAAFDLLGVAIGDEVAVTWCADEAAARERFAELRGKAVCETCSAEVDEDELIEAGEDGPEVCPACATELREEFARAPYACIGRAQIGHDTDPGSPACGWIGTGADIDVEDGLTPCPTCGGEAVEIETAVEAPSP